MSTFLSVKGTCHVHVPLSTGHVWCPHSSQYSAPVMSTFLSVQCTAMTPQLVMTRVHLPLMMRVASPRMWQCVSGWVVSSKSEDCSAFIFNGWTLKYGASHQTQHHIPQYSHPQRQPCENLKSPWCWLPLFYYINFSPCSVLPSHCHSIMLLS